MDIAIPKPWELHPPLVHFPIAFLLGGAAVLFCSVFRPSENANRVGAGMLLAGVITGWLAAAAGGLAYYTVPAHTEFGHTLMVWHLGIALATLVLFSILAIWRWRTRESNSSTSQLVAAIVGFAMVFVTGHLGGVIVMRTGAGVDPAILSAEIRGGHSHQGGHGEMPGMDHSGVSGTGHANDHSHDMESMPGMSHGSNSEQSTTQHDMPG